MMSINRYGYCQFSLNCPSKQTLQEVWESDGGKAWAQAVAWAVAQVDTGQAPGYRQRQQNSLLIFFFRWQNTAASG